MDSTSMSPADFSAIMGGNHDGFYNGGSWWLIVLFLFAMMGGNGFGWNRGNGDFGQYATAASQNEILFGQQFNRLEAKADAINNGICSSTYALNNDIHNAQDVLGGAIVTEGRGLQSQLSQIGCELKTAIHAEGEATRGLIQTNEIQNLRDRLAAVEMDNRMCGVVRYPNQFVYSAGNSPFCNYNGGGCGCNNV